MSRTQRLLLATACTLALTTAAFLSTGLQARDLNETNLDTKGSQTLVGEVWADNWFQLSVNGKKLITDSVPITTERSFNAERFTFKADPPFTFAFEFRDFMENPTGLEYIGSRRQQMGDGGAIAQFKDAQSGKTIAVTDENWRCMVKQHAPVNKSCARERNPTAGSGACAEQKTAVSKSWTSPAFDDSSWPKATSHSAQAVRPKDGYDAIQWDRSAKIIWGPDLEQDNIVLCRITVRG
ncbi:MAG: PEBP family protein [Stappiaceae bacterium]